MPHFREIVDAPRGSKFILQGNAAFALGVVHAGYHAADGYPGTPSTEVIDRSLAHVQDRIQVGWSVNEATAVSLCVGRAIAGYDSVVTMKIPGVFQAGDAISTSAFYTAPAGALVIYAATDYVPSSTQHVIDARYFFSSSRLPVLEPRNHQEMYEIAWTAANMSRKFCTPVVVLASGILAHSEALVKTKKPRTVAPRKLPVDLRQWMLLPPIARANYNKATLNRIPRIQKWIETSKLVDETRGADKWGIITSGESNIIVREALQSIGADPSILSLAATYPIPKERIKAFAKTIKGKLFVIEDGDQWLQDRIQLLGIKAIGKEENSTTTDWTPESVLEFLSRHVKVKYKSAKRKVALQPVKRPPSICPGCAYKAMALSIGKLKKKKKIYASFGDIGCSTLLYFFNALDTVLCMGASDSMRQGFVLSRPEMAAKTVSIIGDSTECHSGLDSTRNAVFRNVPGVKIILDNSITAMTGGQVAPSSDTNLADQAHQFDLVKAVAGEVEKTVVVDAFNKEEVDRELKKALKLAEKGEFTAIIARGTCIHETPREDTIRTIQIDYDKCKNCGLCDMCPGIELDEDKAPHFTSLCTNCGSNTQVCMQICPLDAIVPIKEKAKKSRRKSRKPDIERVPKVKARQLPDILRVAIRGIGGQGNLFFNRVLSEVAMATPYAKTHIVKGDTHGMAQLGGPVISTFGCGNVHSPIAAPLSSDMLIGMEYSEVLRPGFLELLKPGGTIILNEFAAIPIGVKKKEYPSMAAIEKILKPYNVIKIDANKLATELGDKTGATANTIVLGLLSTIAPFDSIPSAIWQSALMKLSPTDSIKSANQIAFNAGRDYHPERKLS
jgi:indolepyruvate ferredoxin oxidoreductase alpha subunit